MRSAYDCAIKTIIPLLRQVLWEWLRNINVAEIIVVAFLFRRTETFTLSWFFFMFCFLYRFTAPTAVSCSSESSAGSNGGMGSSWDGQEGFSPAEVEMFVLYSFDVLKRH